MRKTGNSGRSTTEFRSSFQGENSAENENESISSPITGTTTATTSHHDSAFFEKLRKRDDVGASIWEEQMLVQWSDLYATAVLPKLKVPKGQPTPSREKIVLHGVSGIAFPGTLTAVLGASGAGKTTLLNILNRTGLNQLIISGESLVNGKAMTPKEISRISGFVQQEDLFIGTLRVKEHLLFHANLRMKGKKKEEKSARIEMVMKSMGIKKCENSIIGSPGRVKGISGGEAKRLSFAVELLTDPMLLFCDEPTSGLDSYMAETVVKVLKGMAAEGKTIISTIHQPSSETFAMFDHLYLLGEGRLCFCGSLTETARFFQSLGYPCPPNFNLADHIIHTLAVVPGEEDDRKERIQTIAADFENSSYGKAYKNNIEKAKEIQKLQKHPSFKKFSMQRYYTNPANQFIWLMYRTFKRCSRDPYLLALKIIEAVVLALFLGGLFFSLKLDIHVQSNYAGVFFFLITDILFDLVYGTCDKFPLDFPILMRDYVCGLYSPTIYYFSQVLNSWILAILIVFVRVTIVYWMTTASGLLGENFGTFFIILVVYEIIAQVGIAYGFMISCVGGTLERAIALANPFMIVPLLFGGFFIVTSSIPPALRWLSYTSFWHYGFEAISILIWKDVDKNIPEPCSGQNKTITVMYTQVLHTLDFKESNFTLDIIMLFVLMLTYHLVALTALNIRVRRK